jgi:tRNA(Ile)-lysidine synthase
MQWRNSSPGDPKIQLVRPFLACSKTELLQFARTEKISFREDASNAALDILRNRIRHELLPRLKKRYQPALTKTTARAMEILQANSEFITQCAEEWLEKKKPAFEGLPLALQRRVLQLQLYRKGWPADFDLVERLRSAPNTPLALNPEWVVHRDRAGLLDFAKLPVAEFKPNRMILDLKSKRKSVRFDGLSVGWQINQARKTKLHTSPGSGCEYFDAEKIGRSVILRHWLPGDRFRPIGMNASVKLQDLFSNQKVPRALRHQLAIATTVDGELFWVEGLRISDDFKLDQQTVRTLKWLWQRD